MAADAAGLTAPAERRLISPQSIGLALAHAPRLPETAVVYPAEAGRVAFVTRADLAAAASLTTAGHDQHEYTLNSGTAYSFGDIAQAFAELAGRPIAYVDSEPERYVAQQLAAGFPEPIARFFA